MRLLHTANLILEEFFGFEIPNYAILSHRWEEDEVSLQDFLAIRKLEDPAHAPYVDFLKLSMTTSKESAGYKKIERCCAFVASRGYEWVWIDTCCIDKTSSAELSEAINSMWNWYREAQICYAYLSDVENSPAEVEEGSSVSQQTLEQLKASEWFTRGWTLQELLAPENLMFVDRKWSEIASKRELSSTVAEVTKVPGKAIQSRLTVRDYSAAERMSWASGRKTSREEDIAYCLLGIFEINMPLLYGEGRKAFLRLQQEILRTSADDSLFAWFLEDHRSSALLVGSPASFANSAGIQKRFYFKREQPYHPYLVTNLGLQWNALLCRWHAQAEHEFFVELKCVTKDSLPVLLVLKRQFTEANSTNGYISPSPEPQPYDYFVRDRCVTRDLYGQDSRQSWSEVSRITILVGLTKEDVFYMKYEEFAHRAALNDSWNNKLESSSDDELFTCSLKSSRYVKA